MSLSFILQTMVSVTLCITGTFRCDRFLFLQMSSFQTNWTCFPQSDNRFNLGFSIYWLVTIWLRLYLQQNHYLIQCTSHSNNKYLPCQTMHITRFQPLSEESFSHIAPLPLVPYLFGLHCLHISLITVQPKIIWFSDSVFNSWKVQTL